MICKCCCGCKTELTSRPAPPTSKRGGPRCMPCEVANHFDAAKKASEVVTLHLLADREHAINSWVAVRMSDGGSDGVLYPFKAVAVRQQLHEYQCAYVKIPADGMPPREAEVFLRFNRQLYDAGMRMADPDKDLEVIMPSRLELHP